MAIDTKLRYNPETSEVELVVGEGVAMTSGKDVFESWAKHWAASNGYVPKPDDPPAPVQPVPPTPEPEEVPPVAKETSNVPEGTPVEEVNPSEPARPPGGEDEEDKSQPAA